MSAEQAELFPLAWRWRGREGTSSARFSPCNRYRYELRRTWDATKQPLVVCALNPSKATDLVEDPSVRRMLDFADRWGCGGLVLLNLFAFRSTDPKALRALIKAGADPVGDENDPIIRCVFRENKDGRLLLAWGGHGTLDERGARVAEWALSEHGNPECFGLTKNGQPRHPLYLPNIIVPLPYARCVAESAEASR